MTDNPLAGLKSRYILVGPQPPPVHGFAVAMNGLAMMLQNSGANPLVINLAGEGSRLTIRYHLQRMRRVAAAATALVQERRLRGEPVRVHIGCDGGGGLIYTLLLTAAARLAGCSLCFHHHSYASLKRRRLLMSALIFLGGGKAQHIALRKPMATALSERYGWDVQTKNISNAAFVMPAALAPVDAATYRAAFTIGMLGNLCAEKGLYLFLALVDSLQTEIPGVRVILAGPIARSADRKAVEKRVANGSLAWLGPLSGDAKSDSFYRRVDLLIFPSRYTHEAEPMVLLEAMAHGVPVISTDRGCIRDLTGDAAVIVPDGADFVAVARRAVRTARTDRVWLQQMRGNAWRRFQTERTAALREAAAVLGIPLSEDVTTDTPMLTSPGRISGRPAIRIIPAATNGSAQSSGQ